MKDMKDLIKDALTEAFTLLEKQRPKTKKEIRSIFIDVEPLGLLKFMKDNNVPDDAFFSVHDDSSPFSSQELLLSWYVDVPTTERDDLKYNRNRFNAIAWSRLYPIMIENGYKRVGFNSGLLSNFKDTTVYDMYIEKDFDRLVEYYSLPFIAFI
jgi:hypothetical protein